jgi:hypothetical protein
MITIPPLQKILKGLLHTEDETSITMKGQKVLNLMRKTYKYSESNIVLSVHMQILKLQKHPNGRNHHIPLRVNSEY